MFGLLLQIPTVPATGETTVDFTWLFIKMLLVLGIVTVAAVLILKYAVPHIGVMKKFGQGGYFKVHARYVLEHRKSLYLVEAGKRYFVIGVSDSGISLISEEKELEELRLKS